MTTTYWVDQPVVIDWSLTDVDDAPINNATVTGTVTLPDGTTAAATVSHTPGTNLYRAIYDPTAAGTHAYRLVASGTADDVQQGTFEVRPAPGAGPAPTLDPTTTVGLVRLLIPDTDLDNLLFTDAQLEALLALEGAVTKRAVAAALEVVAANEVMVGKVIKTQDLSTDGAKVSDALLKRAAELRRQADEDDPDSAGGLDIIDFVPPFNRPWHGDGDFTDTWTV